MSNQALLSSPLKSPLTAPCSTVLRIAPKPSIAPFAIAAWNAACVLAVATVRNALKKLSCAAASPIARA
jgi:hypothetical protein